MALCESQCSILVPQPLGGSGCSAPDTRNGGISNLLFFSCDVKFDDVEDCAEWLKYINENKIVSSLEVVGQKPKATSIKKKTTSCRPEAITGFDYSVTFQDYNADNENFSDFDFWNKIQMYYQMFKVGFMTCDGCIYGFVPNDPNPGPYTINPNAGSFIDTFTIEVSQVIEDDFNGSSYWDGMIEWKGKYETKPFCNREITDLILSNGASGCGTTPPPTKDCFFVKSVIANTTVSQTTATVTQTVGVEWGDCRGRVTINAAFADLNGDAYSSGEITNISINGTPGLVGTITHPATTITIVYNYDTNITPDTDIVQATLTLSGDQTCCFSNNSIFVLSGILLDAQGIAPGCISDPGMDMPRVIINNDVTLKLAFDLQWTNLGGCVDVINFIGISGGASSSITTVTLTQINASVAPLGVPAVDEACTIYLTFDKTLPGYIPGELINYSVVYATSCCVTGAFPTVQVKLPECLTVTQGNSVSTTNGVNTAVEVPFTIDWNDCTAPLEITISFVDIVGDAYINGEITGISVNGVAGLTATITPGVTPILVQFFYNNTIVPNTDVVRIDWLNVNTLCEICVNGGNGNNIPLDGENCITTTHSADAPFQVLNEQHYPFTINFNRMGCTDDITIALVTVGGGAIINAVIATPVNGFTPSVNIGGASTCTVDIVFDNNHPDWATNEFPNVFIQLSSPTCCFDPNPYPFFFKT